MKGDFTRFGFRPGQHYSAVLMQQGRVQLDSDWNEEIEIGADAERHTVRDVIGAAGTPKLAPAFSVSLSPDKADLLFSPGDVYVDGLLYQLASAAVPAVFAGGSDQVTLASLTVDGDVLRVGDWVEVLDRNSDAAAQLRRITAVNPALRTVTVDTVLPAFAGSGSPALRRVFSYLTQRMLPQPAALNPLDNRIDLLYLDVWERHVSAVEDPDIREVALGGPDTTTRVQTVLQVRLQAGIASDACDAAVADYPPAAGHGRLSTRVDKLQSPTDLCSIIAGGGYKGLENRLYRVEIHEGGDLGAATFKWSRDNGSLLFPVQEFVSGAPEQIIVTQLSHDRDLGLRRGDWVELLTDTQEFNLQPGILTQIVDINEARRLLTFADAVDTLGGQAYPRVRRWDQGSAAAVTVAAELDLEDGVKIQFSGAGFHAGDYWMFAAREETASVEELLEAPPMGVRHAYARLATIAWSGGGTSPADATITSCLPLFPPLTAIAASDVSYNNDACKLPNAKTVQDALDRLCEESDLRFHNKHLHGWGIVCGLQVQCGPTDQQGVRTQVLVRPGYALDCEGNDVRLAANSTVDVFDLIAKADAATPNSPLLNAEGNADVELILTRDNEGGTGFAVEAHKPKPGWAGLLEGTIWDDFVNGCLVPLKDFYQKQFQFAKNADDAPDSPGNKRLIALLNLIYQLSNTQWGPSVHLSQIEHTLLKDVYDELRKLLASKTYCSLFDGARPFPDYPFKDSQATTLFGKAGQKRLRLSPAGDMLYAVCNDERILVYDVKAQELKSVERFPTQGAVVNDVGFSADGKTLYAIAVTGAGKDSLWASAAIVDKLTWTAPITVCDLELTMMEARAGVFYAVAHGKGVYAFSPASIPNKPDPKWALNATGHIAIADLGQSVQILATFSSGTAVSTKYVGVMVLPLSGPNLGGQQTTPFPLNFDVTGTNGIAVTASVGDLAPRLFASLDQSAVTGLPQLAIFDLKIQPARIASPAGNWAGTDLVIGAMPERGEVVIMRNDHSRMDLLLPKPQLLADVHPLQIDPVSTAYDAKRKVLYVANSASQTVTVLNADELQGAPRIPFAKLAAYRMDMLGAFSDLFGGLLQYLKDCFCDRLLVNCPECDGEDILRLAVVSVRSRQVERVCNFSARKYVKTFPTVGYWLSVIPVVPVIARAVEAFCCSALPAYFRKTNQSSTSADSLSMNNTAVKTAPQILQLNRTSLASAISTLSPDNLKSLMQTGNKRLTDVAQLAGKGAVSQFVDRPSTVIAKPLQQAALVNQPTDAAAKAIQDRAGQVVVQPYDATRGLSNAVRFAGQPSTIPDGSRVTLFEKNGVVQYYEVTKADQVDVGQLQTDVQALHEETTRSAEAVSSGVAAMQASLASMEAQLKERDQQISALQSQWPDAAKLQTRLDALESARAADQAEIKSKVDAINSLQETNTAMSTRLDQMEKSLVKILPRQ